MEEKSDEDTNYNCSWNDPQMLGKALKGGARGVRVIVVGNGHGDTSSNPG